MQLPTPTVTMLPTPIVTILWLVSVGLCVCVDVFALLLLAENLLEQTDPIYPKC